MKLYIHICNQTLQRQTDRQTGRQTDRDKETERKKETYSLTQPRFKPATLYPISRVLAIRTLCLFRHHVNSGPRMDAGGGREQRGRGGRQTTVQYIYRERETDRQTDRQTDRDRERDRERQREREMYIYIIAMMCLRRVGLPRFYVCRTKDITASLTRGQEEPVSIDFRVVII